MPTRILFVANDAFENDLLLNELANRNFNFISEIVAEPSELSATCSHFKPDIIIVNYTVFTGIYESRIEEILQLGAPVLSFARAVGEENAIRLIKAGISDIIFTNDIGALVPKVQAALQDFQQRFVKTVESHEHRDSKSTDGGVLNVLFKHSMEAIFLMVPGGEIIAANPAACEMFGLTERELIDRGKYNIIDVSDPNFQELIEERRRSGSAKGFVTLIGREEKRFPGILSTVLFRNTSGEEQIAIIVEDISSFRETEQQLTQTKVELEETLRELKKIVDFSDDIICTFDHQGNFVNMSAASEKIWGYTPAELVGRDARNYVFSADWDATLQMVELIRNGIPAQIYENRYVHKSGRIVHMLWSGKWDQDSNLIYCIGKDITEAKKLGKSFEVERRRFLDLYEQAPCSMGVLKGPDHVFEMANPLYLDLINKKTDEIMGKSVLDVLPEVASQGFIELLDKVYSTGESLVVIEKLLQLSGPTGKIVEEKYIDLLYQAHRNNDDEIDGILFFVIDVTEKVASRKKVEESEALYRKLIMELPVAAYSCDADGKIVIYNKAAAVLWGQEPTLGVTTWCGSWKSLYANGDALAPEHCPMVLAIREGRTVEGIEIIIERENGERRNVIPHAVPYFNSMQEVVGAVNLRTDITDSKKFELDLQQQNTELIKSNKELDRFVYSVSHDLRSPLTSVLGIVAFIEEESNEPDTIEHIGMIKQSINRLDGFIKKILSYSQNNRTDLDIEPIAVNQTLQQIIGSLQYMAAESPIEFQINITEESPFSSDRVRFNTIIENLISNAIRYRNPQIDHKFIKMSGHVGAGEFIFSITDNGIGIAEHYHEKIFDMFFRISGNSEGSGIGLYIVKDMVERLGGSITVGTVSGCTEFKVRIKNFN